jgi:hypothetical protein
MMEPEPVREPLADDPAEPPEFYPGDDEDYPRRTCPGGFDYAGHDCSKSPKCQDISIQETG